MDNKRVKRSHRHDYHERCIYLVTVTVRDRLRILGQVVGDTTSAKIELSPTGRAVWHEIEVLPQRYPQVRILQHQIMPDHVHLVIYVTERLPENLPLGNIVASWKVACSKACAVLNNGQRDLKAATQDNPQRASMVLSCEAAFRSPKTSPLFDKGYNDSILTSRGQLDHIMAYVRDNPRRLLIKQQRHPFFAIHHSLNISGIIFDAVGNLELLRCPKMAVHCQRHWSETELNEYTERCIKASEQGIVLVGAFISKAERDIALRANKGKRPLIHLMENGFPELYKPIGHAFYSCAEGKLLQLAPWPYHNESRAISRSQCMELNRMAELIAS